MNFMRVLDKSILSDIFLYYETCWLRNRMDSGRRMFFINEMENISEDARNRALKTISRNGTDDNGCPLQLLKMKSVKKRVLQAMVFFF